MYMNTKWKLKNHGKFQRPSVSEDILNNGGNCVKTSCSANIQILKFFPPPFHVLCHGVPVPYLSQSWTLAFCVHRPPHFWTSKKTSLCLPPYPHKRNPKIYLPTFQQPSGMINRSSPNFKEVSTQSPPPFFGRGFRGNTLDMSTSGHKYIT